MSTFLSDVARVGFVLAVFYALGVGFADAIAASHRGKS